MNLLARPYWFPWLLDLCLAPVIAGRSPNRWLQLLVRATVPTIQVALAVVRMRGRSM